MTLVEFLLARIAEDEAAASLSKWPYGKGRSESPPWPTEQQWSRQLNSDEGPILAMSSPGRWLAECEAKRRIVELFARGEQYGVVLRLIALPYADHPDYREEWKP